MYLAGNAWGMWQSLQVATAWCGPARPGVVHVVHDVAVAARRGIVGQVRRALRVRGREEAQPDDAAEQQRQRRPRLQRHRPPTACASRGAGHRFAHRASCARPRVPGTWTAGWFGRPSSCGTGLLDRQIVAPDALPRVEPKVLRWGTQWMGDLHVPGSRPRRAAKDSEGAEPSVGAASGTLSRRRYDVSGGSRRPPDAGSELAVALAQSAEHWIVAPEVTGSSPVGHPTTSAAEARVPQAG